MDFDIFEIKTVTIIKIKKKSKLFKNFLCKIIKLDRVAMLLYLETWKNLEFDNLGKKNL